MAKPSAWDTDEEESVRVSSEFESLREARSVPTSPAEIEDLIEAFLANEPVGFMNSSTLDGRWGILNLATDSWIGGPSGPVSLGVGDGLRWRGKEITLKDEVEVVQMIHRFCDATADSFHEPREQYIPKPFPRSGQFVSEQTGRTVEAE